MKAEPIYEIIKRKKLGIDCTEAESAEVKGWLRDIPIPFPQPIFNEVKELFPLEYGEFLEEVEISYKDKLKLFNEAVKSERKYYLFTCSEANIYREDHKKLTDAEFIALAEREQLVFTEAEFVKAFNNDSCINPDQHFLRII